MENFTIKGNHPVMEKILNICQRVAATDSTVLIMGESGTGKELIARYIHAHSRRANQPFIAVNCGAIPPDLLESEMFGHERGAFTGAVGAKTGLVFEARGGTLFLDEVGELPMDVQAKLLRLLQEKEVRPLGSQRVVKVDVRVVAATWRDLRARVADGAFREDLLYRLAVFELALPPLRERGDDVVLLAQHVVDGFARQPGIGRRALGRSAGAALRGHEWRGNVRELQAVLARAAVLGDGRTISGADIRAALPEKAPAASIEERLTALIASAGEVTMGHVMAALRVPRTTAWRAMAALVEAGHVEAVGETKGRRYRVVSVKGTMNAVDPRWEQVFALARREGTVSRRRVMEVLGVPERTAGRLLGAMASSGALRVDGLGRRARYILAPS